MKEIELEAKYTVLKEQLLDRETQLLQEKEKTRIANDEKLVIMQESLAKDDTINRIQKDLAEQQTKASRLSKDLEKERLTNYELGSKNDRLNVEHELLNEDIKLVKERLTRLQDEMTETKKRFTKTQKDLERAVVKANEEAVLRSQAVQRTINAENTAAEIQNENAILIEQISGKSQEIYDSTKARSEGAKRELELQNTITKLRKEYDELKEEFRELKRLYNQIKEQKKLKLRIKT